MKAGFSAQGLKAYRESNKNKNWRERTPIVLYFLHMLDFIDSEMSGQRIYFKDLACYQEASEEERKKCGREPYFDLSFTANATASEGMGCLH